jgi:probable phosphoglycerate mutase
VETARPITARTGAPLTIIEALSEIDFGEFEGRTYDEIAAASPELYAQWMTSPTSVRFSSGEDFATLRIRVNAAIREVLSKHRDQGVVAVTHAGPIRAVVGDLFRIPDESLFSLDITHASLTLIDWVAGSPVLRFLNHATYRQRMSASGSSTQQPPGAGLSRPTEAPSVRSSTQA